MLKLQFCKVADVFNRNRRFLFTANVKISPSGEAELVFQTMIPVEELDIEGYVTFYDDVEGLVTYWCSFFNMRRAGQGKMALNLSVEDLIDTVQRRHDLKTRVRFKIEIDYTDHKGRMRFCQGEVENISAGGVFFTSEHKFALGDSVVLRLSEISPRLFAKSHLLRIQGLDGWESSQWLIKSTEAPLAPPKPPVPEGQNIFSFMKKRKQAEPEPVVEAPKEERGPKMAFEVEEDVIPEGRVVEADLGGETERFGYGCKFNKINEAHEIAIRRFVFEQERLRLQTN